MQELVGGDALCAIDVLEMPDGVCSVLVCMLEAVEGVCCVMEAVKGVLCMLEVSDGVRCVMLCTREPVEGVLCAGACWR